MRAETESLKKRPNSRKKGGRLPLTVAGLAASLLLFPAAARCENNINRVEANANLNNSGKETVTAHDISAPPSLWSLPLTHRWTTMQPDIKSLRARIEASVNFPKYADPVTLRAVKKDPFSLLEQLGQDHFTKGTETKQDKWILGNERLVENISRRLAKGKVIVEPEDLAWIDLQKLSKLLQIRTAIPEMDLDDWADALATPETRYSLELYLGSQFNRIAKQIEDYRNANRDRDSIPFVNLLPPALQSLYGRYSFLRGRNCFGTALEFANPRSIINKSINIEAEEGHFRTMINSDEFMRALWLGYYELKPDEILTGLRWGDVVVFYDSTPPLAWTSLRHAAVHLADTIYFHKQSKSAASPIELTDWQSLIGTWAAITPNLDYKVFRPLPEGNAFLSPSRAMEKLSWTR